MRAFIRNLQSKSEIQKKQIRFVSLAVCMVVVGSIWAYSLGDRFSSSQVVATDANATTAQDSTENDGPFTLFSHSISGAYHNIAASVGNISFSGKSNTETRDKQIDLIVVDK